MKNHDGEYVRIQTTDVKPECPRKWAEEAYKEYQAQFGNRQSFERMQERGGFGHQEMIMLLYQRCKRLEAKARAI